MAGRPHWWRDFFSGLWQDVQLGMWSEEETSEQVDRIEKVLELQAGSRVLDVPCGEGRISLELAARGHRVTGVDFTERFLEEARRKAGERGLSLDWEQLDMRELPWEAEFDAAINFWGSFGYFEPEGNARFASVVNRALRPGGRLLVETHVVETVLPDFQERDWFQAGEVLVLQENRYDSASGRIENDWTFVREGTTERRTSSIRFYTYRELAELLEEAGFEDPRGFDSTTLEPFALGANRLTMVATKAG